MDKLYSISKTADILGVSQKTLRVWDKQDKLKPVLTSGGHRRYKESDIQRLTEGLKNQYDIGFNTGSNKMQLLIFDSLYKLLHDEYPEINTNIFIEQLKTYI